MDPRLELAPVVVTCAEAVRPIADVVGFYAGGSLASGDYHPGISDLDLVAVVADRLDDRRRRALRDYHEALRRDEPSAAKLHCVYVPRNDVANVTTPHATWAHGELYQRALSGIARAELLQGGITVLGPPPAELLPDVDPSGLKEAARTELVDIWLRNTRKPWLWRADVYVDLGLLTLTRADATLTEGRLITKREALGRLDRFDVPADLIRQIERRRNGEPVSLTRVARVRRALTARRLVARGIRRVLIREG